MNDATLRLGKTTEKILPGHAVAPATYAQLVHALTDSSRAYIAILEWRKSLIGLRERRYVDICGAESPLAVVSGSARYDLALPDYSHLRYVDLTVFYRDDSVLHVSLGKGDRARVIRNGSLGEAESRLLDAVNVIKGKRRFYPDIAVGYLLAIALMTAGLYYRVFLLAGLMIAVLTVAVSGGFLRPRESRIGLAWRFLGFGKDDLRRLLTALASGTIIFLLGLWVGGRG